MKHFCWKGVLIGAMLATLAMNVVVADEASTVAHSQISPHPPSDCGSGYWDIHYGDAYKTLREAEEFKPGERNWYVRELNDHRNEYLLAGISPSFRKDWLVSHETPASETHCIVPLFDAIGAAAKRTLPGYRPVSYKTHDATEENLIKDVVKSRIPDAEFLDTVLNQASWDIEKLNNGLPMDRYKFGIAWIKSAKFDDGFCRMVRVKVLQDYAGGGTYAETKVVYYDILPAGCK